MISIIIPLHNLGSNGDYCLRKCLDSILAQTYTDFEVLLMENGSTDDTVEVAQEYCNKDNRFKLHILDTIGVSYARNKGLDLANGDYISFIDGDDCISNDYLKSANNIISENNNVDIIFLPWSFSYNNKKIKNIVSFNENKIINRPNIDNKNITSFICSKIIKTNLIKNNLYFNTDMEIGEDTLFITEVFFIAKLIAFSKSGMYYYTQSRTNQITKSYNYKKLDNLFFIFFTQLKLIYKKYNVLNENKDNINYALISFLVGDKFAQTSISKSKLSDIKKFILINKEKILKIETSEINCKQWQKNWLKKFQKSIMHGYGHIFLKIMRIYRNLLPKILLKKLYP